MESTKEVLNFNFDNSFNDNLEGFFVSCNSEPSTSPRLLQFNKNLAIELGLSPDLLDSKEGLDIFSGNNLPIGSKPLAQAYSGHQFGGFSPLLGDGRALLLGEMIDSNNQRRDIQLKGSGRTPFSRGGDGKSALGPVLREYLMSEYMHVLGIPTTRALAAVATGDEVNREIPLPGGILTRVASSHIRVGTFQFGTALGKIEKIRAIADYSIGRHYPEVADSENPYLAFFESVSNAQASLVAKWMSIGFIHGVMNTDNMTITGETIDYGPCAFMDNYSSGTVFSSIDTNGRYAYSNQPSILSWNLTRLAETLVPLIDDNQDKAVELLTAAIENISPLYKSHWLVQMRSKIGLTTENSSDEKLINDLLLIMEEEQADFTLVFRRLSEVLQGNCNKARKLFTDSTSFDGWSARWKDRLIKDGNTAESVAIKMDQINPIYIPRNHKMEEALSAAVESDDMTLFINLLAVTSSPFEEEKGREQYALPSPDSDAPYKTYCGT
jgi:uncharacterized protein YdiU (UPF0061 family)